MLQAISRTLYEGLTNSRERVIKWSYFPESNAPRYSYREDRTNLEILEERAAEPWAQEPHLLCRPFALLKPRINLSPVCAFRKTTLFCSWSWYIVRVATRQWNSTAGGHTRGIPIPTYSYTMYKRMHKAHGTMIYPTPFHQDVDEVGSSELVGCRWRDGIRVVLGWGSSSVNNGRLGNGAISAHLLLNVLNSLANLGGGGVRGWGGSSDVGMCADGRGPDERSGKRYPSPSFLPSPSWL